MDDATVDSILAIQLEDLRLLEQELNNTVETGASENTKVALDAYRQELQANSIIVNDRRYGQKLGDAVDENRPLSPVVSATPIFDDALTSSLAQLTVEEASSSDTDLSTSSELYRDAGTGYCTACHDEVSHWKFIEAPCGDLYCEPCIVELFGLAMKDELLFPPRCCKQPIGLETAGSALSEAHRQAFEEKALEYYTIDRTYCQGATSSVFIPPNQIDGEKAACQTCQRLTCRVCKAEAHDVDCPKDENYVALMETAAAAGFQKCYQCKRLVELNLGCYHMTCVFASSRSDTKELIFLGVSVVLNFATYVVLNGKDAPVRSGMKIDFWLELNRTSTVLLGNEGNPE